MVIYDVMVRTRSYRRLSLQSKAVIFTSAFLLIAGTLTVEADENISWTGAFFHKHRREDGGFLHLQIGGPSATRGVHPYVILMFIGLLPVPRAAA